MVLRLLKICISALHQANILLYFRLVPHSLVIQLLEHLSFLDVKPLSQLFKLACDLMLQILVCLVNIPLLRFKLTLMHLQLFDLLTNIVNQLLKLLLDCWIGFSQSLYLMALMLAVDNAF